MSIENLLLLAAIGFPTALVFYCLAMRSPVLDDCPHCGLNDQTEGEDGPYRCPICFRSTGKSGYGQVSQ